MKCIPGVLMALFCFVTLHGFGQDQGGDDFRPAIGKKKHYNALYILNEKDDKKIRGLLRNIDNVLDDPRLKGKLHIEVIAFSDGVEMYKKTNNYQSLLTALKSRGVVFAQCANTIRERKIEKAELFDFVHYVPSGNGEIILRQYEGWAVVHP
jgi:intracellular sulfur oxidation DsrE/DsrF family protein